MAELMLALGIGLLVVGGLIALFAMGGILGKKKVGGAVALVLIVAGLVAGGMGGLFPLAAAPSDDLFPGEPVYMVTFLDASPWSGDLVTGLSQIVNPEFTVLDALANDTNYGTDAQWDVAIIDFIVARTDAGDADDTQIYFLDMGIVDTITDVSAGTTFTILDYDDTTDSYDSSFAETTGADNAPGLIARNRYFVSGAPGFRHDISLTFDGNQAAFGTGPSVVGSSYTFTIVAAGQVLTVNIVVSAA